MPAVYSGGLASGIDTNSLIAQLVQLQKAPISKLQQKQGAVGTKAGKLTDLNTKLKALQTAAEKFSSKADLLAYTATSGDTDVLTASATGSASAATYSLNVTGLATAEKNQSNGFSSQSSSATVAGGTLSFSVNGETAVDVTIDAGDSLVDIAAAINGKDAGVTATILNDGQGGATSYKLLITREATGYTTASASDALTISSSVAELSFTETTTATNATFTLDGDPTVYSRTSNSVSDLLTGLTFNLKAIGTASVEVSSDVDTVKDNVKEFVTAYNSLKSTLNSELKITKDTNRSTSLGGEVFIRRLQQELTELVSEEAGTGGTYETLASIGITTSSAGTLSFDEDAFEEALAADPDAVASVFVQGSTGAFALVDAMVDRYTDTVDGPLTVAMKSLSSVQTRLTKQIERINERADSYEQRLRRQFTAMEQLIANIQSQGQRLNAALGAV